MFFKKKKKETDINIILADLEELQKNLLKSNQELINSFYQEGRKHVYRTI